MSDDTYICHKCGNIFRIPAGACVPDPENVRCDKCDSTQTRELPSWVPLGSDLSEGQVKWQYECQQCKNKFELPVPSSPSGENNIRCPACNGSHIHRLVLSGYEPLYCG